MTQPKQLGLETLAIHAGQEPDPTSGAVMTPIVLASTFAQDGPGAHKGYEYSRSGNPTRHALERCLAALEGGSHGFAFGSGCAATTILLHTLGPGDHVVSGDDVYGGTFRIFDKVMRPFGVDSTFVDMTDPDNVKKRLRPKTRMIWLETPSNPLLKIFDIAAIAEIAQRGGRRGRRRQHLRHAGAPAPARARRHRGRPLDDEVHQRPLRCGRRRVGDERRQLAERVKFLQNAMGAVPSPFDCYLVLRGLKTLPVRMRQHVTAARPLGRAPGRAPPGPDASTTRVCRAIRRHAPAAAANEGPRGDDQLRNRRGFRTNSGLLTEPLHLCLRREPGGGRIAGRAPGAR